MVGFIYLFLEKKYHIRLLGAIVVPLVFSLSAFAIFYASKDIVPLMPALRSHWLYLHVVTAFIGYAGFTVGFGGAVLYLLKDKFPNMPLPSKEVLDEITYKSIVSLSYMDCIHNSWCCLGKRGLGWILELGSKRGMGSYSVAIFWSLSSCEADAWMERQKNRMDGGLWLYNCVDMLLCSKPLLPWAS